jgi:hypothetical protein
MPELKEPAGVVLFAQRVLLLSLLCMNIPLLGVPTSIFWPSQRDFLDCSRMNLG